MVRSSRSSPDWDHLYEVAAAQAGYFTVNQAREAGYSRQLLSYHQQQGRLERVRRGVYRLRHFPAGDREDLVVAWLWSERSGVFSHLTALALHELSDALPSQLHMTLPANWEERRIQVPGSMILYFEDLPREDRDWFGPVPVTTPLRTLIDCYRLPAPPEWVHQAIDEGLGRGLFSRQQLVSSLPELVKDHDGIAPRHS